MSLVSTVLGIGALLLGAVFILPKVLPQKTEAEKAKDVQDEQKRQEKGAIGNTVDFLFGEGITSKVFGNPELSNEERVKILETKASQQGLAGFKAGKNTVIDPKTGIITSDTSPTFQLSEEEKRIIREKNLQQKIGLTAARNRRIG